MTIVIYYVLNLSSSHATLVGRYFEVTTERLFSKRSNSKPDYSGCDIIFVLVGEIDRFHTPSLDDEDVSHHS